MLNHRTSVKYFDKSVVQPNVTQMPCPDNAATVRINATSPSAIDCKPIHASKFEIARSNNLATAQAQPCTTYRIGQSPPEDTCADFLVAGLESGLGLYQFVSERTNRGKQSRSNTAVIQLLQKMREQSGDQPLMLGNRFEVVGFERAQQPSSSGYCLRYHLTVKDKHNKDRALTVPITQAGLPFQDAVLHAEAIADASTMMNEHLALLPKGPDGSQNEPLTLSHAGYGRNATLMTYRDLTLRIEEGSVTTNGQIEDQLHEFIKAQRNMRPGFVHSLEQVEQLVVALEKKLEQHQGQPQQQVAAPEIRPRRAQSSARIEPLRAGAASVALAPQMATFQGEIKAMPVEGIAVDGNHKHDFKDVLDAASMAHPHSRIRRFTAIARPSPPPSKKLCLSHSGQSQHVLETGLRARQQRDTHPYLPEDVVKFVDQTLAAAAASGLKSIGFAATLLQPTQPTKAGHLGIPFEQMAALAVAAVDRQAEHSGQPIRVTFQCASDHEQRILNNVITNKEKFKDHQNYQALMRLPNTLPTPIPTTACADFGNPEKLASFAPVSLGTGPDGTLVFNPATALPTSVPRSAIPLEPWTDVPTTRKQWEDGDKHFPNEPPGDGVHAAGVVILEDDGRVWVVAPTGGFAGMTNTFAKGQRDWDPSTRQLWSPQSTARKEAYEESGLQVELTGFIAAYTGHKTTRYYLAKRIGGTPADVGWESQAVHLVPQDELRGLLKRTNNLRERTILDVLGVPPHAGSAQSL